MENLEAAAQAQRQKHPNQDQNQNQNQNQKRNQNQSQSQDRKADNNTNISSSSSGGGGGGGDSSLHYLPTQSIWVNMSARVGSVTDNRLGGWFSYRSSKAAVNSLTKSLDYALRMRGGDKAMAMAYHPGTVKTDLSRDFWGSIANDKLFTPEYAVEAMARVVLGAGLEQRGKVWDYNGEEVLP